MTLVIATTVEVGNDTVARAIMQRQLSLTGILNELAALKLSHQDVESDVKMATMDMHAVRVTQLSIVAGWLASTLDREATAPATPGGTDAAH